MGSWRAKINGWGLALLATLAVPVSAAADEYHYNSVIIGERPTGMGGAYTAVSDDSSGLFYNPAGTVYSQGSNLSVSANAYTNSVRTYNNATGVNSYTRRSENFQPNFFGVVQHTPFGTIGFSYAVQDSLLEDQHQTIANPTPLVSSWTLNYLKEYNVYNIGPSIAFNASDDLKIGMTLYFHYKKYKVVNNSYQTYADGTRRWTNSQGLLDEQGFRPLIGVLYAPENGKYSVGFAFSQTTLIGSNVYQQYAEKEAHAGDLTGDTAQDYTTNPYFRTTESSDKANYPYNIRFGGAYFPTNALLIAADISYYGGSTDTIWGNRQPVLNISLGAEYYLSSSWAVRGGIFTDKANTKNPTSASSPEHIDLTGISASMTYFVKGTSVTFGFTDAFGSGKHWINNLSSSAQSMSQNSMMVFLGTSYSY